MARVIMYVLRRGDMTGKELLKLLKQNGWQVERINGSHHTLKKGTETLTVPIHGNTDVKKGLLIATLKKAGLK